MAKRDRCVRRLVHAFGSTRRQRQLKERDLAQVELFPLSRHSTVAGRAVLITLRPLKMLQERSCA